MIDRWRRWLPAVGRTRSGPAAARPSASPTAAPVPPSPPVPNEPTPEQPDPLPAFDLCAVVKTWDDEDLIEAVVRNATAQGVDRVFVVDNASTDATVARAEAAGAVVAEVYDTPVFDGRLAQTLMNAVVARETLRRAADHVWWLYLDSDEFPAGPDGTTVRRYLAGLDRHFRLVGATFLNHLPTAAPAVLPGIHPIDLQPLCYEFAPVRQPPCPLGHWKHPLQRLDRGRHFVQSTPGAHSAVCSDRLVEPVGGIVVHHFQYRDEARTRQKLARTWGPAGGRADLYEDRGGGGFARRVRSLDAVYAGRWADVETVPCRDPGGARHPAPWPGADQVARWYGPEDLAEARAAWVQAGAAGRAGIAGRPV